MPIEDIKVLGSKYFQSIFDEGPQEQEPINYSKKRLPIGREIRTGEVFYLDVKDALRMVFIGLSGCVDSETEFLTPTGWKRIDQYKEGDRVMQAEVIDDEIHSSFVEPIRYIKLPEDTMYHFKTKYGLDQCLSGEHKVLYRSPKSKKFIIKSMSEIYEIHKENKTGFSGQFPTTFQKKRRIKRKFSDDEIRLITACIADGSILKPKLKFRNGKVCNNIAFNIKKQRKVERLIKILDNLGIEYSRIYMNSDYQRISFFWKYVTKEYNSEWYDLSYDELKIFADESLQWDGNIGKKGRRSFSTTVKSDVDFVQYCFSTTGRRASININDRRGRKRVINGKEYITESIEYKLCITDRGFCSLMFANSIEGKGKIDIIQPNDGHKYCFEVPSGFLILRRNNKIFVTGNSGKTFGIRGMMDRLYQIGYASCYMSDVKGEMISGLKPVQPHFQHLLLPGEEPTALPIAELRPTFFMRTGDLPKKNLWYSADMKSMTEREFTTLMSGSKLSPSQGMLIQVIYKEMQKIFEENPEEDFSVELINEIIDGIENLNDNSARAMKIKFAPLNESPFYIPKYMKNLVDGISRGYVPAINLTNFEDFGDSGFQFPTVTMSIILRELIKARREKRIPPLWLIVDEATRFCGKSKRNSFKSELMESVDVDRRFSVSICGIFQAINDIPEKFLNQSRYIFIPGRENVDTIKKILQNTGMAVHHSKAGKKADNYKRACIGHKFAWIVFDRVEQSVNIIDFIAPLSAHLEES